MNNPLFFVRSVEARCRRLIVASFLFAIAAIPSLLAHDDDDLSSIPDGPTSFLPNTNTNPVLYGKVGPLIVMHAMSVHNTITWKTNSDAMGVLMFHRHSAYRADEVANPDIINFLISNVDPITGRNAYGNPANQFNSSFRRTFDQLCYGGYTIVHDVSQSVPTRIKVDQTIELCQLWDTSHPDAYNYDRANPKYSVALLNNHDAETNFAAWKGMGPSRGLYYDMYCPGFCTLEDGRPIFPGGHDMNSQNGNYRIQVYNPDSESWLQRPISCMRQLFGSDPNDPYFEKWFQAQKDLGKREEQIYLPTGNSLSGDCNPHDISPTDYSKLYPRIRLLGTNGTVTHPQRLPGDMRYARWYPTAVALPGNKAFIFAGWDRDEFERPSNGPVSNTTTALANFFASAKYNLPASWRLAGYLSASGNNAFLATKIVQSVPEVYDGNTDTTYALENARLFHGGWYPNATVVQTGPGTNDWGVIVLDGELFESVAELGGESANLPNNASTKTWLVDVQGALADPDRDLPNVRAGKWIKYIDRSPTSHTPFSANSTLVELDTEGKVVSHRLYHFGGSSTTGGGATDAAEMLDLTSLSKARVSGEPAIRSPKWVSLRGKLYQRARQNYATPLPDGKILIMGGNGGTLGGIESWSLHVQMFDPETGLITKMDKTLVPRDEHGIIQLWPDGTVYLGGQNRNGIVQSGDVAAPGGDADLGVNVGQFFSPPYLFDANTNAAVRPVIIQSPQQIDYGVNFEVTVDAPSDIKSIALIRSGSMSHSLCTDRRYVKVPFSQLQSGALHVTAPVYPGTAVGGYYMLFVVNKQGVPSLAKKVILGGAVLARK